MSSLVRGLLLLLIVTKAAAIDSESFEDPQLHKRYQTLTHELRCPKCQNQNIADSDAPISADFRREVRDLLIAGKTDEEVKRFLTDRYGDFVLYRTPFAARTAVLWIAPGLAFVGALVAVVVIIRRHTNQSFDESSEREPSATEQKTTGTGA